MEHLIGHPNLEFLVLWNTDVTDTGLLRLAKLESLVTLQVDGTKITKRGLEAFRRQRPWVEVSPSPEGMPREPSL